MTKVARLRLTKGVAESRIHEISKDSFKVVLGAHAKERMVERDIVRRDVDRALRNGFVDDEPVVGAKKGEWKCKIVLSIRGRRDLGVVVILRPNGDLWVKTVEWEDSK